MNTGIIDRDRVKVAVYNRIKFELPTAIWEAIDTAFGDYRNDVIGFGNYVGFEETVNYIDNQLKKKKIMFSYDKLEDIVNIIYDYIEMTGGFLDEDTLAIPRAPLTDE